MINLTITLPEFIYYQLKAMAHKEDKPIHTLLTDLISQRVSPPPLSQKVSAMNKQKDSYHKFVTEWARHEDLNNLHPIVKPFLWKRFEAVGMVS